MRPVYPEYLNDFAVLTCPSDPNADMSPSIGAQADAQKLINNSAYTYLGYVITNDAELQSFLKAYSDRLASGQPFNADLDVPGGTGTGGGDKILRLREGIEKLLPAGAGKNAEAYAESAIPIMWDRIGGSLDDFYHIPGGINVLYMDGHVEFIRYPGKWPATKKAMELWSKFDLLGPEKE
ncbi:MAG: hypothetical protein HZB26_02660 [Candidatus Hydrogenedentes bacterium]|nr:hypothetical protein [Candidatus Hydrogenedentota bacterium]